MQQDCRRQPRTQRLATARRDGGRHPWRLPDYEQKFRTLTEGLIAAEESARFLADARRLTALTAAEVRRLNPALPAGRVKPDRPTGEGIMDWGK